MKLPSFEGCSEVHCHCTRKVYCSLRGAIVYVYTTLFLVPVGPSVFYTAALPKGLEQSKGTIAI